MHGGGELTDEDTQQLKSLCRGLDREPALKPVKPVSALPPSGNWTGTLCKALKAEVDASKRAEDRSSKKQRTLHHYFGWALPRLRFPAFKARAQTKPRASKSSRLYSLGSW